MVLRGLFVNACFHGKKIQTPVLVEKLFFSVECIFLGKVNEMTLVGYFPLKVNKNLGLQNDAEFNPRFGINLLKNVDCKVRYLLGINRYHTSAVVQPIP